MEKIGIGIIGTGFARRTQIPAFSHLEDAEIISVSSGSVENAKSAALEFGIPHFSGDWRQTVSHPEVDLVCITTPPNLHLQMAVAAFENGKHVLCEKPMAMNVAECEEMCRLARGSERLALIDHELRFTNGRLKAFEMVRNGMLGEIRHAKYMFRNASRGNPNLPWTWWSDIEQGGGALGAIASHSIDSFRWFLGTEIQEVTCRLHTHIKERPFRDGARPVTSDDETMMLLRFEDGDLVQDATAVVSISLVEGGPYRNRIELYGSKGALRIEDGGEIFMADLDNSAWKPVEYELGPIAQGMPVGGWSRGFTAISKLIVDAIQDGATAVENAATFEDGLAAQKVLDAARLSDSEGRSVRIQMD